MELLHGGELLDRIVKKESFYEREASAILEVLASTLNYLHENGVSKKIYIILIFNSIFF